MKLKSDPRHINRIKLMQQLFSWDFRAEKKPPTAIAKIISKLPSLDGIIAKAAPDRPIEQINKVDLSILRLATFELIMEKGTPPKVVLDEAVELGKEFGSDSSPAFINGALGQVVKLKKIRT